MNTRARGAEGEREAERFLCGHGAVVLERNYARRGGEIDLIVRLQDIIVFVEVKQRTTGRYGSPGEAVTKAKQVRIGRTALQYIRSHHLEEERMRFDVIEVTPMGIRHIVGAFDFSM